MRFIYLVLAVAVCCNGAWIIGEGDELLGVVHLCFGFQFIVLSRLAAVASGLAKWRVECRPNVTGPTIRRGEGRPRR